MAAPEGYTALGRIGYVDKGVYSSTATYMTGYVVYYNGSSYVALKDNVVGITPTNSGTVWKIFARGFQADTAADVEATDTPGIVGTAGAKSTVQGIIDKLGDWFTATFKKNLVNNGTTTAEGFALDARMGKTLTDQISALNSSRFKAGQRVADALDINYPAGLYSTDTSSTNLPYNTYGFLLLIVNDSTVWRTAIFIPTSCEYIALNFYNGATIKAWSGWRLASATALSTK